MAMPPMAGCERGRGGGGARFGGEPRAGVLTGAWKSLLAVLPFLAVPWALAHPPLLTWLRGETCRHAPPVRGVTTRDPGLLPLPKQMPSTHIPLPMPGAESAAAPLQSALDGTPRAPRFATVEPPNPAAHEPGTLFDMSGVAAAVIDAAEGAALLLLLPWLLLWP